MRKEQVQLDASDPDDTDISKLSLQGNGLILQRDTKGSKHQLFLAMEYNEWNKILIQTNLKYESEIKMQHLPYRLFYRPL